MLTANLLFITKTAGQFQPKKFLENSKATLERNLPVSGCRGWSERRECSGKIGLCFYAGFSGAGLRMRFSGHCQQCCLSALSGTYQELVSEGHGDGCCRHVPPEDQHGGDTCRTELPPSADERGSFLGGREPAAFFQVADCGSLCRNFYEAGQLYGPDEVQPGDLVIFSWSKERSSYWPASSLGYKTLDHVEFCVAVDDDTIKCIGANNGGAECDDYQTKTRSKSNISCCCRPKYNDYSVVSNVPENYHTTAESSSSVSSVQSWLNSNYSTGLDVDGVFGPKTKAALVKALQTELNRQFGAGLVVDGIFGRCTASATVCLYVGAQGNITKTLQGFLICYGYSTNGFDGIFGSGTMNAVMSFQRDNYATADGIAGPITWRLLAA